MSTPATAFARRDRRLMNASEPNATTTTNMSIAKARRASAWMNVQGALGYVSAGLSGG
jgi:hypothetical protein